MFLLSLNQMNFYLILKPDIIKKSPQRRGLKKYSGYIMPDYLPK